MASRGVEGALFSALQELGRVFGEKRVMNAAWPDARQGAQFEGSAREVWKSIAGAAEALQKSMSGLPVGCPQRPVTSLQKKKR